MTLVDAADEIDCRLIALFRRGPSGRRPSDGNRIESSDSPLWNSQVTFSEYFHGDTGEGLGASHQTGWTALIAHVLCPPLSKSMIRSSPELADSWCLASAGYWGSPARRQRASQPWHPHW